jgi:hypothetical protein
MKKETFVDSTYSLGKSLHLLKLAKDYLEDVRRDTKGEVKLVFNSYINKCDWVINDVKTRLTRESRDILNMELEDSFIIDAINDKLIHLDNSQRNQIESLIDSMIEGEEIKVINE